MNSEIKSISGNFSFEDLLARSQEVGQKIHPNFQLNVIGFTATEEARAILNQKIDLGGVKYAHAQESADGRIVFQTFVYPMESSPSIIRGRTRLAVILDSQIVDKFLSERVDDNDDELTRSLFNSLLSCARALEANPTELYFQVTL